MVSMNDSEYLRGRCDQCGGEIEFPATAAGQTTPCPLCGHNTNLAAVPTAPPAAARSPKRGVQRGVAFTILGAVVVAVLGVTILTKKPNPPVQLQMPAASSSNPPTAKATAPANTAPAPATNSIPSAPTKPRSLDDLKTGTVSLEKAKNSSLVYAVGVLRNESDHQRFGVTVEVELNDPRGNAAGTAKDYRAVIEPRQEWRFRALVLNSKATEGKVTRIREE